MRISLTTCCALYCACFASPATAETDWYLGAGTGLALHSGMDQAGWNEDTVCYPTDACFDNDPVPPVSGYRWRYAIDAQSGAGLEITLGRRLGGFRIEVSAAQSRNDLEQRFTSIEYLDGSARLPRNGTVVADVTTSIGDLTQRFVSLSAYHDFRASGSRVMPYLGIGVGAAFANVRNLRFSADYRDPSPMPPAYDPPLSFYGGTQNAEHSDIVLAVHAHAGIDYPIGRKTLVGAKLTCSRIEDTADDGNYLRHPMHAQDPGFSNRNTFGAARACTTTIALKRSLGR